MDKKKVITISGDSSKWYDKVIFVVKNDKIKENSIYENNLYKNIDFVLEAERIVSQHILKSDKNINYNSVDNSGIVKNNNKIDMFFYITMSFSIILIAILIISYL